jgi:ceramide glucosyltransferase
VIAQKAGRHKICPYSNEHRITEMARQRECRWLSTAECWTHSGKREKTDIFAPCSHSRPVVISGHMFKLLLPYLFLLPATIYSILTLYCAARFFRRGPLPGAALPPVTILKPVKGADPGTFENFASFCCQDYPEFQIIFAVSASDDPAIHIIERIIESYPLVPIELVVDPAVCGENRKVCNLLNGYRAARHDIIVIADSDIRVGPDYLKNLSGFFADPETGLVTSLYRSSRVHGAVTAIEALGFTAEMIPNVLVAEKLEGLSFALGASMAVRRQALESIGGFHALVDYLADDYQLGYQIHRAGWRIQLSGDFVESVLGEENFSSILSRQIRWCRTMRVSRPGGYLASGIVHPFAGVAIFLAVAGFSALPLLPAALFYLLRAVIVSVFSRLFVRDNLCPKYLWLLPLRDLLSLITWGLAFTGNRVTWRGDLFKLEPGGKIRRLTGNSLL